MKNPQIDSLLGNSEILKLRITERMNFYSSLFLGMEYNLKCAGDGPYALLENWPLVNFQQTNCMLFCEHVLALAISDSWDNFFNNLQQIRYKDGIIGMRTRNHYTMADWLPENSWILSDVTGSIGKKLTRQTTRTISHRSFFEGKGIKDLRYVKDDRTLTIDYLPIEHLGKFEDSLKTGDILALIFADKKDIFSAHMMMIAEKDGIKYIRESSGSRMSTFDTPYNKWADERKGNSKYAGISVMRVNMNLNEPGRIILPWEIFKLKDKNQVSP